MKPLRRLIESRFWVLTVKEIGQILRNKQLIFLLVFPPTVQLLIFGLALNPDVQNLKLGVVDYSNTPMSRELVSALTANGVFQVDRAPPNEQILGEQVRRGEVTTGLVIPPTFNRDLKSDHSAEVQVLIDAVDANTAGIASGYAAQIINQFSQKLAPQSSAAIETQATILYNPGLVSSWFIVPGVLGLVLNLGSSLVSTATVVREKDTGTLEQLLMTPAAAWEIILAKVVPLFVLLLGEVMLAVTVATLVFHVPFRGNFFLFMGFSGLYICVGIGIGFLLATISRSQQQAILTSFFINLPLIQLSGAIAPIESMPRFFQILSLFNPLRHYVKIARSLLLKGSGLDVLYPEALALTAFAIALLAISTYKFRTQLS
ncbi:MAG: ABC transporter permease [Candidatus Parcubacteria bacterium]|uniref:ABC transporter permease n=1 Tax=Phormidesmis priestleyi TaxID=268141 RepID=UPI000839F5DD|nr:ABC transporter permease [Phormidesmis priestleyi]MBC7823642.1 ABC transporter permease [Leptolyngbyaceae cyanobacterium LF-bin-113]